VPMDSDLKGCTCLRWILNSLVYVVRWELRGEHFMWAVEEKPYRVTGQYYSVDHGYGVEVAEDRGVGYNHPHDRAWFHREEDVFLNFEDSKKWVEAKNLNTLSGGSRQLVNVA